MQFFQPNREKSVMVSDTECGGSLVNGRSTTGYCTLHEDSRVLWRSKKQDLVCNVKCISRVQSYDTRDL